MNIVVRLIVTAAIAYFLQQVLKGVHFNSFGTAFLFVIVLALLNVFIKPVFQFFGLPLTILTLGLFSLVINAAIIMLADYFVDGMVVDGFWWALVFSVLSSFITSILLPSDD